MYVNRYVAVQCIKSFIIYLAVSVCYCITLSFGKTSNSFLAMHMLWPYKTVSSVLTLLYTKSIEAPVISHRAISHS